MFSTLHLDKVDKKHKNYKFLKKFYTYYNSGDIQLILTALSSIFKDRMEEIVTSKYGDNDISPILMAEKLSEQDWQNIFNFYQDLKKEQVEILIDIFSNHKSYPIKDRGGYTLKNVFIEKIQGEREKNKKIFE